MTVGDEQVQIAVIVNVKEFHTPAAHLNRCFPDSIGNRHVVKCVVVIVVIERVHFPIDIRDKKIGPTIVVKVRRIDAHSGTSTSLCAVGDT